MSSDDNANLTYAQKMGIESVDIAYLPRLIKRCYSLGLILCVVGQSGIGKTVSFLETAEAMGVKLIKFMLGHMLPEDLAGIPCPNHDKKVMEFYRVAKFPDPKDTEGGIILFDEANRSDPSTHKPFFQFLDSREIGGYHLPECWTPMVAMNPDDDVYNVSSFEPAFRRRVVLVEVTTSVGSWLEYARSKEFHPAVIDYVRRHPKALLNREALQNGMVFANPASWEKASDILYSLDTPNDYAFVAPLVAGLVEETHAKGLGKNLSKHMLQVDPADIIHNYDKVASKIAVLVEDGKADVLNELGQAAIVEATGLTEDSSEDYLKNIAGNIAKFFDALPEDQAVIFGKDLLEATQVKSKQISVNLSKHLSRNRTLKAKLTRLKRLMKGQPQESNEQVVPQV